MIINQKYLFIFIFLFFGGIAQAQADSVIGLEVKPWYVYQVHKGQTLWQFAENLGVPRDKIAPFLKEVQKDNPRLNSPHRIYPADKIIVSETTMMTFIDP